MRGLSGDTEQRKPASLYHLQPGWGPAAEEKMTGAASAADQQLLNQYTCIEFTGFPPLSIILRLQAWNMSDWIVTKSWGAKGQRFNKGWTVPLNAALLVAPSPSQRCYPKVILKAVWLKMWLRRFHKKCNKPQEGKYIKQSWLRMFCRTAWRPIHQGTVFI